MKACVSEKSSSRRDLGPRGSQRSFANFDFDLIEGLIIIFFLLRVEVRVYRYLCYTCVGFYWCMVFVGRL